MRFGSKDYISYAASLLTLNGLLFYLSGQWFFIYLILLLILPLLIPMTGLPIIQLWKKVTHFIGKVNGWILLTFIFFIVLSPLAILRRVMGNDILKIKKPSSDSFFNSTEKDYTLEDLKNLW